MIQFYMTTYQLYLVLLGYISHAETVIDSADNGEMIKSILLELYNRTRNDKKETGNDKKEDLD